MYARSSTIRGNSECLDAGIAYVRDKVMPAVGQMDGCVGLSMLVDRESGRCIVTTAWADSEALRRSAEAIRVMRLKTAEIMQGDSEVNEWEIGVLHRMQGNLPAALADFNTALQVSPYLQEAQLLKQVWTDDQTGPHPAQQSGQDKLRHCASGEAALRNGRSDEARQAFEKCLSARPETDFIHLYCRWQVQQLTESDAESTP